MRSAPSVTFPVGRCRFYAWILVLLAGLGAAVLCVWLTSVESRRIWYAVWGALAWLIWLLFAAWSWQRSPAGRLSWDASCGTHGEWLWRSASCIEGAPLLRVQPVLDLQDHVLLRLHNADSLTRWVWVERAREPGRWHDLRRALVACT